MKTQDILTIIKQSGYPVLVYDGKPYIPPYIEKIILMAYAMGYKERPAKTDLDWTYAQEISLDRQTSSGT